MPDRRPHPCARAAQTVLHSSMVTGRHCTSLEVEHLLLETSLHCSRGTLWYGCLSTFLLANWLIVIISFGLSQDISFLSLTSLHPKI